MQYRLKAMTEKTVVCGQDFPERDSYAERILLSPKMNFASRAVCEKQNVVAALKQTKAAGYKITLQFEWYHGYFFRLKSNEAVLFFIWRFNYG